MSICSLKYAMGYEMGVFGFGMHPGCFVLVLVDRKNNKKFRSFKSKENIYKKEVGPYHGFGY